jgi:hypothetical protein
MTTTAEKVAIMQAHVDGKVIEYRPKFSSSMEWLRVVDPTWSWGNTDYRIKPTQTDVYRRGIWKRKDGSTFVSLIHEKWHDPTGLERQKEFIRWIDTDWQYHEV